MTNWDTKKTAITRFYPQATALVLVFTFSFLVCSPFDLLAAEVAAPQQTVVPQQGEITLEAAQARVEASPSPIPPSSLESFDTSPLSAPSVTENEIKTKAAEAAESITQNGRNISNEIRDRINNLKQPSTGTPLENLTASLEETVTNLNDSAIIPKSNRASDLLNIINSPLQSYDEKLEAYTELDGIREEFENGVLSQKIKSLEEDTQYVEDLNTTLSPLWSQSKSTYADLLSAGSDFRSQAEGLKAQMTDLSSKYPDVPVIQTEFENLLAGLADAVSRFDADAIAAKAILDSAIGTRNPNDVKARLKLLQDAVANDTNFYAGQIDYYASELLYAKNKAELLGDLMNEGAGIVNAAKIQIALIKEQVEAMRNDADALRKAQPDAVFNPRLTNLEAQLSELLDRVQTAKVQMDSIYEEIQTRNSPGEIQGLLKNLEDAAQAFDPAKDSSLIAAAAALREDLDRYRALGEAYDTAKKLSSSVLTSPFFDRVSELTAGFNQLNDAESVKALNALGLLMEKDRSKAEELLGKILASLDPNTAAKLNDDLLTVSLKFLDIPMNSAETVSYYQQQINYYTAALETAQKRAQEMNELTLKGQKTLDSIQSQSLLLSQQLEILLKDIVALKTSQSDAVLTDALSALEQKTKDLSAQAAADMAQAQDLFQQIQASNSPETMQSLVKQLETLSQAFDPAKDSSYNATALSLQTALDLYQNIAAAYANAKTISQSILNSPYFNALNELLVTAQGLGETSIAKDLQALTVEMAADRTQTEALLGKILATLDLKTTDKLLGEMKAIALKFQGTASEPSYYAAKIDDYTKALANAKTPLDPKLEKYIAQGERILASIEAKAAANNRQLDSILAGFNHLQAEQAGTGLSEPLNQSEKNIAAVREEISEAILKAQVIFESLQNQRTAADMKTLIEKLNEVSRFFAPSNEEGVRPEIIAIRKDLTYYKQIASIYNQARRLESIIMKNSAAEQVETLMATFEGLGDTSGYKESKSIAKELESLQNDIKADQEKTEALLKKILSSRDLTQAAGFLEEMKEIRLDFISSRSDDSYRKRIIELRRDIQSLSAKKAKDDKEKARAAKKK